MVSHLENHEVRMLLICGEQTLAGGLEHRMRDLDGPLGGRKILAHQNIDVGDLVANLGFRGLHLRILLGGLSLQLIGHAPQGRGAGP